MENPCLSCGACCAYFRVSFHWSEASENGVPAPLIEPIHPIFFAMRGTTTNPARCIALQGDVGREVCCTIYPLRPSPCRELAPWDDRHHPDEKCTKARIAHGLAPLMPPAHGVEAPGHPHR